MHLRDALVMELCALHLSLQDADSVGSFFQIKDEIAHVSHISRVIDSMLVNSFFDMEGTVSRFMEDMKDV
jgi:hypothetical protein